MLSGVFCLLAFFCHKFGASFSTFLQNSQSEAKSFAPASNMQPSIADFSAGQSISQFGTQMFATLCREPQGNVVISPLSLSLALSMATAGTSLGGQAHAQLSRLLNWPDISSSADKEKLDSEIQDKQKAFLHSSDSDDPLVGACTVQRSLLNK